MMSSEFQRRHVEIATWQTEIQHTWPSETKKKLENLLNLGFPASISRFGTEFGGAGTTKLIVETIVRQ